MRSYTDSVFADDVKEIEALQRSIEKLDAKIREVENELRPEKLRLGYQLREKLNELAENSGDISEGFRHFGLCALESQISPEAWVDVESGKLEFWFSSRECY